MWTTKDNEMSNRNKHDGRARRLVTWWQRLVWLAPSIILHLPIFNIWSLVCQWEKAQLVVRLPSSTQPCLVILSSLFSRLSRQLIFDFFSFLFFSCFHFFFSLCPLLLFVNYSYCHGWSKLSRWSVIKPLTSVAVVFLCAFDFDWRSRRLRLSIWFSTDEWKK